MPLLSFSYCVLRFSQVLLYKILQHFPILSKRTSPECYISHDDHVMSSSTEMLCGNSTSYHVSHWAIINISNWQTLLLIRTPVPSLYTTLWNANTSYEMSPKFLTSRSHFCEHFKDLRINNTGGTVVHFSDCWDTQMLWEVSLGTKKQYCNVLVRMASLKQLV